MSDLSELYQEVILDHNKRPRNFRKMEDANRSAIGRNPLCGDTVRVFLRVENGKIEDVSFEGAGCAISKASASLMTTELKGKTEAEAEIIFEDFHKLVTGESVQGEEQLGKLAVFSGVQDYPARVKCASLAWHTVHAALKSEDQPVSTE